MQVQIHDATMPIISRIFNQHEHPDLGQYSEIKTFTIHDNLLANPNPDILPDNRKNADRSHCDIIAWKGHIEFCVENVSLNINLLNKQL